MVLGMQGAGFGDPHADRELAVIRINLLGALYQLLGCEGPADPYMESSLALLREPDYRMSSDTEGAISLYEDALAAAKELGNLGGKMLCLTNLGSARLASREHQAAAKDLLQVTSLAEGVEWFGVSEAHRLLAEAWLREGRVADALESAQQALTHAEVVEQQAFVGKSWRTLGKVAMQSDTPVVVDDTHYDARECFANSVKLLKQAGARAERARTLIIWADYELERGDRQQGETMRQSAKRIFGQLGIILPQSSPTRP
jgi:tetratricopeptide (TPR) repeat protein